MSDYSVKPVAANYPTLAARLTARADEIDHRVAPIPGSVADSITRELRQAAKALSQTTEIA